MGLISDGTTIFDAGALDSGIAKGAMIHIKTLTASSSGTLSFVHGASSVVLDNTYKEYMFIFSSMHPATDSAHFQVGFRDGGSDYDAIKTTTYYQAYNAEDDSARGVAYDTDEDLHNAAGFQNICKSIGNGNNESGSGELFLFNPSSTTFVTHFMSSAVTGHTADNYILNVFTGGYCNVTAAIDGVQFSMHSGNIDSGIIKLYGIKDS